MAKPKATKKGKKTKAPRKAQPLPRSVQALLKYLGGSDVRVGGARGGQPATLAPTSINIAVSQQQAQQQAQAQQFVQQRVAPKGQVIGQSPLTQVISQQPIILGLPQRVSDREDNEKKMEQEKQAEVKQNEINRKLGLLEASQDQFRKAAATAYQDVKNDLSRRIAGDANIFDARNLAARFTPRPVVEEQQFAGMSFGKAAEASRGAEAITVTEVFRGAVEEEGSSGLGEYLGGQYIKNVSNPEMTPIVRGRGRPRKASGGEAAVKAPRAKKGTTKIPAADVSSLLEQRAPSGGFTVMPVTDPSALFRPTRKILVKKKPVSTAGAPDMATQIAMLTGGGAAAPQQSTGQTIADLLGATRK
jgi:hypothetical protein